MNAETIKARILNKLDEPKNWFPLDEDTGTCVRFMVEEGKGWYKDVQVHFDENAIHVIRVTWTFIMGKDVFAEHAVKAREALHTFPDYIKQRAEILEHKKTVQYSKSVELNNHTINDLNPEIEELLKESSRILNRLLTMADIQTNFRF